MFSKRYKRSRIQRKDEKGVVLIISLAMMIAITVLVVSMINISSNQFVVIGNYQIQKEAENAARQGLEQFINSQTGFSNVIDSANGSVPYFGVPTGNIYTSSTTINGYLVQITVPYCYGALTAPGYSAISSIAPEDTHWVITSVATNTTTGAKVTIQEGIKIRLASGNCGTVF